MKKQYIALVVLLITAAFFLLKKKDNKSTIDFSKLPETKFNSLQMKFVLIPAGNFFMGVRDGEITVHKDGYPVHRVFITRPFYISEFEVLQADWEQVMEYNFSSVQAGDLNLPVDNVSWEEVQEFIKKLNELENTNKYRLPTEAEWEYACRAGTETPYFFAEEYSSPADIKDIIKEYAWVMENSGRKIQQVGVKEPNPYGLYDVLGNVSEWCQDWYDESYYSDSPQNDPPGPDIKDFQVLHESGKTKVRRGGSIYVSAGLVHPGLRAKKYYRRDRYNGKDFSGTGFRLLMDVETEQEDKGGIKK